MSEFLIKHRNKFLIVAVFSFTLVALVFFLITPSGQFLVPLPTPTPTPVGPPAPPAAPAEPSTLAALGPWLAVASFFLSCVTTIVSTISAVLGWGLAIRKDRRETRESQRNT